MSRLRLGSVVACAVGALGCFAPPPHVVLTVEDPGGAAAGWESLHVGLSPDTVAPVALRQQSLPAEVTVSAGTPGNHVVWVEARGEEGAPLARGSATARFARRHPSPVTVSLARVCVADADCVDGRFCSGVMECVGGVCVTTIFPCTSEFPCVINACVDLGGGAGTCDLSVDHTACPADSYCDPIAGCVPGPRCMPENGGVDCNDGRACNGVEQCDRYRCEPGTPPIVDDGDPCTLDGCNDALGPPAGPVFHEVITANEGAPCSTSVGVVGVCSVAAGRCLSCDVPLRCGSACTACTEETPLCLGATAGCACETSPAPHGSCPQGQRCDGTACVACDDALLCGPDCAPCSGATPLCGGPQAGCVAASCAGQPDFTPCRLVTTPDRWYDICVDGACVSPGCGDATCNPPGPSFARADREPGWQYPDGNQSTCCDADGVIPCTAFPCAADGGPDFCGQDAQYGWDSTHPDPSTHWARSAGEEPVVADYVTGLEWQGCVAGLRGNGCDADGLFMLGFTWEEALAHCNDSRWAGYNDWRLPDIFEVLSLADFSGDRATAQYFPRAREYGFPWSLTTVAIVGVHAWAAWGTHLWDWPKDSANTVLCVRRGSAPLAWGPGARFARLEPNVGSAEFVVTDRRTGLVWLGCAIGESGWGCWGTATPLTWAAALRGCEGLTWAGATDWRLPSLAELQTIRALRTTAGAPDAAFFPGDWARPHWTSTSHPDVRKSYGFSREVRSSTQSRDSEAMATCVRSGP